MISLILKVFPGLTRIKERLGNLEARADNQREENHLAYERGQRHEKAISRADRELEELKRRVQLLVEENMTIKTRMLREHLKRNARNLFPRPFVVTARPGPSESVREVFMRAGLIKGGQQAVTEPVPLLKPSDSPHTAALHVEFMTCKQFLADERFLKEPWRGGFTEGQFTRAAYEHGKGQKITFKMRRTRARNYSHSWPANMLVHVAVKLAAEKAPQ